MAVGTEKPKYPFCSLDKSAALFIALYLNGMFMLGCVLHMPCFYDKDLIPHPTRLPANNPNLKLHVRKQYEQALNEFRAKCDIVQFLAKTMTKEYQVEGKRHAEFEGKMQEFLNSQKKGFDKPGSTVAANANARPAGERS